MRYRELSWAIYLPPLTSPDSSFNANKLMWRDKPQISKFLTQEGNTIYPKQSQTLRDAFYIRVFRGEGATEKFRVILN